MRFAGWREYEDMDTRDDRPIQRDITGYDKMMHEQKRRETRTAEPAAPKSAKQNPEPKNNTK